MSSYCFFKHVRECYKENAAKLFEEQSDRMRGDVHKLDYRKFLLGYKEKDFHQ